jgi:hypothetical protein
MPLAMAVAASPHRAAPNSAFAFTRGIDRMPSARVQSVGFRDEQDYGMAEFVMQGSCPINRPNRGSEAT